MDPIHVVDGIGPEGPSHQEVGPCLRALLRHSRAHPRHVLHPIVLLNLHIPISSPCMCCGADIITSEAANMMLESPPPLPSKQHNVLLSAESMAQCQCINGCISTGHPLCRMCRDTVAYHMRGVFAVYRHSQGTCTGKSIMIFLSLSALFPSWKTKQAEIIQSFPYATKGAYSPFGQNTVRTTLQLQVRFVHAVTAVHKASDGEYRH